MFKLTNKIALVTGGGSGIGAAIAETFARAGALVCIADINEESGRAVLKKITDAGGQRGIFAAGCGEGSGLPAGGGESSGGARAAGCAGEQCGDRLRGNIAADERGGPGPALRGECARGVQSDEGVSGVDGGAEVGGDHQPGVDRRGGGDPRPAGVLHHEIRGGGIDEEHGAGSFAPGDSRELHLSGAGGNAVRESAAGGISGPGAGVSGDGGDAIDGEDVAAGGDRGGGALPRERRSGQRHGQRADD